MHFRFVKHLLRFSIQTQISLLSASNDLYYSLNIFNIKEIHYTFSLLSLPIDRQTQRAQSICQSFLYVRGRYSQHMRMLKNYLDKE